jgi:hypothetical protein
VLYLCRAICRHRLLHRHLCKIVGIHLRGASASGLACLLFNSSRWLFDGWLRQTANYILLMVIMAIMTNSSPGWKTSMDA